MYGWYEHYYSPILCIVRMGAILESDEYSKEEKANAIREVYNEGYITKEDVIELGAEYL